MTLSDTTNRNNAIKSVCYVNPLWIALAFKYSISASLYDSDDWNETINERTPTIETLCTFNMNVVYAIYGLLSRISAYGLHLVLLMRYGMVK